MILNVDSGNWIWLVLTTLAVWYVTMAVCYLDGPRQLFTGLRRFIYRLHLGGVVECPFCAAFWLALIAVLLIYRVSGDSIVLTLAVAGGVSLLERLLPDLEGEPDRGSIDA
jgi:hypothetical protein